MLDHIIKDLTPFIESNKSEMTFLLNSKKYKQMKTLSGFLGLRCETYTDNNKKYTKIVKPENWKRVQPEGKLRVNKYTIKKILNTVFYKLYKNYNFSYSEKNDILKYCSIGLHSFDDWEDKYIKTCHCGQRVLSNKIHGLFEYNGKFVYDLINKKQWYADCNKLCSDVICRNCCNDICEHCFGVKRGPLKEELYPCVCFRNTQKNPYYDINQNGGHQIRYTCVGCVQNNKDYELNKRKTEHFFEPSSSRRRMLEDLLSNYKIELRNDSVLCNTFIYNGVIALDSLEDTAKRMAEMHYLYLYTAYPDLVCFHDKEYAEETALREMGGYPNQWPWLA